MSRLIIKSIIIMAAIFSAACVSNVSTSTGKEELGETLTALVQEAIDGSFGSVPGVTLSIKSRGKDVDAAIGIGYDSKKKENELSIDQPFRIASITKTFVAVSILRLHEMDSLSVTDPISKYISKDHQEILISDEYDLSAITILHCLQHISGLFDYAVGTKYKDKVLGNPDKRWTRTEQLQGAVDWGDKLGDPGDVYEYSDTGYILLGEIIEYFFDGDLAAGIRTLVDFENLGLAHTWLESLEDKPIGMKDPVHCYFGREDVIDFDPSLDLYGGGGLISTTGDLVKFVDGIFNGEIFDSEETLNLMLTKPDMNEPVGEQRDNKREYRCGIVGMPLYGKEIFAHSGIWDVYVLHDPTTNTSIATNFTNRHRYRMIKKVVKTIDQLPDVNSAL